MIKHSSLYKQKRLTASWSIRYKKVRLNRKQKCLQLCVCVHYFEWIRWASDACMADVCNVVAKGIDLCEVYTLHIGIRRSGMIANESNINYFFLSTMIVCYLDVIFLTDYKI